MSLTEMKLESNSKIRIDFGGGNLSSDGGLLLMKEFLSKIGFERLAAAKFKTIDGAKRFHSDVENLMQVMYQIFSSYNEDDCADELSNEPVITATLEKDRLAFQPTLSRFYNRMDENTLQQFSDMLVELRKIVYRINPPKHVLFDLDSTLLRLFGNQEGKGYNVHYAAVGYHPLLCYDGLNGDLLKAELRNGTQYCGKDAAKFMQSLFDEFNDNYYQTQLFLRGDSGFAMPDLFDACEDNGCKYAIRLKENATLRKLAAELDDILYDRTKENAIDYAEVFGEFEYQASSWRQPRRVVVKIEKPYGQMDHRYTFIVTNMDLPIRDVVRFYCNRGTMENFMFWKKSLLKTVITRVFPGMNKPYAITSTTLRNPGKSTGIMNTSGFMNMFSIRRPETRCSLTLARRHWAKMKLYILFAFCCATAVFCWYMLRTTSSMRWRHDGDWTDLLPEQAGGKVVDYTAVAAAWEVQRARMGLENEGEPD